MSSKNTSISQEEIRFLLKDFPCGCMGSEEDNAYETPFTATTLPVRRDLKHESLAKQIRRLFAASIDNKL